MVAPSSDYERRLIDNIQPIRYFFLANVLHHAFELGIFAELERVPGASAGEIAARLGLDAERLRATLAYLRNENYLLEEDGEWSLTAKGAGVAQFAPWYQMCVGGYAITFQQIGDVLRAGAGYATRDSYQVGMGSTGLGVTDTLPLAMQLLDAGAAKCDTLVDLGCGDGRFTIEILKRRPELRGIGVDPTPASIERAVRLRDESGLRDRLEFVTATAADVPALDLPANGSGIAFLTAFVLQEMLEQDGEGRVEDLLRATFDAFPDAVWVVVEMDYQPDSPLLGAHGLARAFYNPYFLIHNITQQRLKPRGWWISLFERAGLEATAATTDPRVDSTGLEIGFLLSKPK